MTQGEAVLLKPDHLLRDPNRGQPPAAPAGGLLRDQNPGRPCGELPGRLVPPRCVKRAENDKEDGEFPQRILEVVLAKLR